MASLLGNIMGNVVTKSAAEKAFHPWWDVLEDYCVYSLVLVGLMLVPQAIISGTPLFCTFCLENYCEKDSDRTIERKFDSNETYENKFDNGTYITKDPGFAAWWVKNYCTYSGERHGESAVKTFVLFYPYFLLMFALTLYLVESGFKELFRTGTKLNKLFKLLQKYKIFDEDEDNDGGKNLEASMKVTESEAIQLKFFFRKDRNYFLSYFFRTVLEIALACSFLFYMTLYGHPILMQVNCPVSSLS